jgi:cystathionine beta-lyase/cystathionine gamma-synthase
MVSTEKGRLELAQKGLNPYLVRLSVGTEPFEVVFKVITDALDAMLR